jgi:hypothetical protein
MKRISLLFFCSVFLMILGCSQIKTANVDPAKEYQENDAFLLVRVHAHKTGNIGIWKGDIIKIAQLEQTKEDQLRLVPVKVVKGATITNYYYDEYAANFEGVIINIEPGAINYIGDVHIGLVEGEVKSFSQSLIDGWNMASSQRVDTQKNNIYAGIVIKDNEQDTVRQAAALFPGLLDKYPVINQVPKKQQATARMVFVGRI